MSATNTVGNYNLGVSSSVERAKAEKDKTASGKVSHTDFLKLLTKQLTTQDPLKPMEDIDFTAQLAQLQALDEQMAMTKSMAAMRQDSQLQAGTSMIGKFASSTDSEGNDIVGKVARVIQKDNEIYVELENQQRIAISDINRVWSEASDNYGQLSGASNAIGMWVYAGIDPESKQPIEGIVEKVVMNDSKPYLKLYGGRIIDYNSVKEMRAPTDDEIWYTLPDDLRTKVEKAKEMQGNYVVGTDADNKPHLGIVKDAVLKGSSVYLVLLDGTQLSIDNIMSSNAPTRDDVTRSMEGMWVKGLDLDGNDVEGVVREVEERSDGFVLKLPGGKEVYLDLVTSARVATGKELEDAGLTYGDGDDEGEGDTEPAPEVDPEEVP